jgi:hypothetical protein
VLVNAGTMAAQAALIADTIMGMKRALRKEQDCEYSLFFSHLLHEFFAPLQCRD